MNKKDKDITIFDNTELYEKEIAPLVQKIRATCALNNLPFVCSFAVKSEENKTSYVNAGFLTGSNQIHLADDKFPTFLIALHGAELKLRGREEEMQQKAIDYILNNDFEIDKDEDTAFENVGDI